MKSGISKVSHGVLLGILGAMFLGIMTSTLKWYQLDCWASIMWIGFIGTVICSIKILKENRVAQVQQEIRLLSLRSIFAVSTTILYFYLIRNCGIKLAVFAANLSPIVTVLVLLAMGDRFQKLTIFWIFILVSSLIINSGMDGITITNLNVILVILCASTLSASFMCLSKLAKKVDISVISFVYFLTFFILGTIKSSSSIKDFEYKLVLVGICGVFGQLLTTFAFRSLNLLSAIGINQTSYFFTFLFGVILGLEKAQLSSFISVLLVLLASYCINLEIRRVAKVI